jgi:tRNA 2-thiouridine synthesizing protein E
MGNMKNSNWLTTGQAADLCSVTPATVLNWVRKGRLEGVRTAGGHYRIKRDALALLLSEELSSEFGLPQHGNHSPQPLRCWEYFSDGKVLREECRRCVVFRVRAARCFQMAGLGADLGHARMFCQSSCQNCVYYRRVIGLPTDVLVATSDEDLVHYLKDSDSESIVLHFARSAYEASAVVQSFLPGFAVVDQEMLTAGDRGLLESLAYDPRLPGLKIIVAIPRGGADAVGNERNGHSVVDMIEKPFGPHEIKAVIDAFPVETVEQGELGSFGPTPERGRTMTQEDGITLEASRDEDGFLKTMASWNPSTAEAFAKEHDIGPLTDAHWRVIEFVQWYYKTYGSGPPAIRVHQETGLSLTEICDLFPCGMVKGAYRLAGLPRPPGCA